MEDGHGWMVDDDDERNEESKREREGGGRGRKGSRVETGKERTACDERQQGEMPGDVQSRMKTDMRRVREFTVDVPVVDTPRDGSIERANISEILITRAQT